MGPWPINTATFDGKKFATRYRLNNGLNPDFYAAVKNGVTHLFLREGVTILDDPPIFDILDPPGPTATDLINDPGLGVSLQLKQILLRLARGR